MSYTFVNEGTWGLTYGVATFMACQSILMIASGASKRAVVSQLLGGSTSLPATSLLTHPSFKLLIDRAAHG